MAEVQAIKDDDTIRMVGHLLSIRCHPQMADVWHIGLNLALRISDLLSIRFEDINGDRLIIRESKTGKLTNIQFNTKAQQHIARLREQHPDHTYLFQSNRCQELNIALGTHSMRKTRGYFLYQSTKDIGRVMKMLRPGFYH
ncbi:MAG: tyrosine-type recombinase/integrase [Vibrio toranzoniae]